jgi:hypothetical protein
MSGTKKRDENDFEDLPKIAKTSVGVPPGKLEEPAFGLENRGSSGEPSGTF